MKRALVLCLFVALGANSADCATTFFPPLQPLKQENLLTDNAANSVAEPLEKKSFLPAARANYARLNEVERSLYGKVFANQDILNRLSRLETSIFSTTYPNLALVQRVDNIVANFNQINKQPNISKGDLSKLESKVLGRNYAQDNLQSRVERLEQQLLGAVQEGDLTDRYETLKVASQNSNFAQNLTNDYYPNSVMPNRGGLRGMLGNIGAAMLGGGMMTGYSPSLDPFYSQNTYGNNYGTNYGTNCGNGWYNNSGHGMYNGNRSNTGYSDSFRDYGSSSRVTILD